MELQAESLGSYLNRIVDELGIKEIGSGGYSVVFAHPTDKSLVVKISIDDNPYMKFVEFCTNNKGNPWLPQIVDVHRLELSHEPHRKVWAVFLPKLKRATKAQVDALFSELAPWLGEKDVFSEKTRFSFPQWRNVLRTTLDPQLHEVVKFLVQNFNLLDLQTSNFMIQNDHVIFNDPLARRI